MKKLFAVLLAMCLMIPAFGAMAETLTMGTNAAFAPYEYYEGETIVGIDAEIAAAIAEKLGMDLEIVDTDFGAIIGDVQTGKCSIGMAGMSVTPERLQSVSFSDTYATGVQVVIVTEDSDIASVADLGAEGADWKIGVQESTTGAIYCADDYGDDRVDPYKTGADAVAALKSGKVKCVVIDSEPAKKFVEANEGLKILDTEYVTEEYAIAIAQENTELLENINKALKELTDAGTIQTIIDQYINAD